MKSLKTNEGDDLLDEPSDDADGIINDNEDNLILEMNLNSDNYRLFKAKAAHDAVLGISDGSVAKKTLTAKVAPHLDTKTLIAKLDDVAKTVDLDVSTILVEQIKHQFLVISDLGYIMEFHLKRNHPKINSPNDYFVIAMN